MKIGSKNHLWAVSNYSFVATSLLALLGATSPSAGAESISYNFSENAGNQQLNTTTPKGPLGSSYWNDSNAEGAPASGSEANLLNGSGVVTSAAISWSSTNTWYNGSGVDSENARIMVGYLDDGAPGAQVTVSNIPYAKYNVYGILGSDQGTQYTTGDFRVNGNWVFGVDLPQAVNQGSLGTAGNSTLMGGVFYDDGALAGADQPSIGVVPGQIVKVPYNAALNPSGPFTVEAWLKPATELAPGGLSSALACGNFADPRSGWLIYQSDTGWNFRTYNQNGLNTAVNITGGSAPVAGTWYHVVAVWDGSVGRIYVNGALAATSSSTTYVAGVNGDFHLGSRSDGAFGWNGSLDEVAFYNSALSAGTIASHYANGTDAARTTPYETLVLASSPVGYWRGAQIQVPSAGTAPAFGTWGSSGEQWTRIDHKSGTRGNFWKISGLSGSTCTIQGGPRAGDVRSSLGAVIIEEYIVPDRLVRVGNDVFEEVALGSGLTSEFRPGTDSAAVTGAGLFSVAAPHTVSITPVKGTPSGTYTLIDYSAAGAIGGSGFAGLSLAPSNTRYGLSLVDNAADKSVDLTYTAPEGLVWTNSAGTGVWDNNSSANWTTLSGTTPLPFQVFDEVEFSDVAPGGTISIVGNVTPLSMRFVGDDSSYTFTGGSITGSTDLVAEGFGTLTLAQNNGFTGDISLAFGTLVAAAEEALGTTTTGKLSLSFAPTLKSTVDLTSSRPLSIDGSGATIDVAADTRFIQNNTAAISGPVVKEGSGVLRFQGYQATSGITNTFFDVRGGMLEFGTSHFNRYPFGFGTFQANVDPDGVLRLAADHSLGGDYWDYQFSIGTLRITGGALQVDGAQYIPKSVTGGSGRIQLDGGFIGGSAALLSVSYDSPANDDGRYSTIDVLASEATSEIWNSGGLDTGWRDMVLHVEDGGADVDLLLAAPITGANGVIKTGSGKLLFTGSALNAGTNDIREGTLVVGISASLGSSTLNLEPGTTLELDYDGTKTVASFQIDNIPQASGIWGKPGSILSAGATHESALINGDGLLQVGDGSSDPFESWISTNYPGLSGADATRAGNPDADGYDNLTEFALDGNPISGADSGKLRARIEQIGGQSALVLTFPVRGSASGVTFSGTTSLSATVDGVTYTVQGSNGLDAFNAAVAALPAALADGMPPLSDATGWHYRSFRLVGDIPARGATGFLRVVVE